MARRMQKHCKFLRRKTIVIFHILWYNTDEMIQKYKKLQVSLLAVLLVGSSVVTIVPGTEPMTGTMSVYAESTHASSPLVRQAERLSKRLRKFSLTTPSIPELTKALEHRQALLRRSATIALETIDGTPFAPWQVSLNRYPTWLQATFQYGKADFHVDRGAVIAYLTQNGIDGVIAPTAAILEAKSPDNRGTLRATTTGVAKPGYAFDVEEAATIAIEAITVSEPPKTLAIARAPGIVINRTGEDLGALTLLAEGRSNFAGSVPGRIANVRKGLKDHVNNVLVAPGETFFFNSTLGPVTTGAGWYMALAIFNGQDLVPVPGGGICQVATTAYRAILNAGLPIVKRKQHSLYVSYYEKHGVGLDATVYPGQQDLTFVNDTGNWLLIQAYSDGFEASVNIYGTPDGREVELVGPYFTANVPEDLLPNGLKRNEIAWSRTVTYSDGREQKEAILSRYKELPKSLAKKYIDLAIAEKEKEQAAHAAAPDKITMR